MSDLRPTSDDPNAPFGRDGDGTPKAPYGLKVDGTPRTSNRGARPGQRGNGGTSPGRRRATGASPKASLSNLTDVERKGMLTELVDMLVVTPLASASKAPFLESRLGLRQADALAGDAFIVSAYFPHVADGLILLSKSKPRTLAWLDKAEENAPYIVLAQAVMQMGKAVLDNHLKPNSRVAEAGRNLAALKVAEMAEAINRQAAAMQDRTEEMATAA